jgi:hypothetical protein
MTVGVGTAGGMASGGSTGGGSSAADGEGGTGASFGRGGWLSSRDTGSGAEGTGAALSAAAGTEADGSMAEGTGASSGGPTADPGPLGISISTLLPLVSIARFCGLGERGGSTMVDEGGGPSDCRGFRRGLGGDTAGSAGPVEVGRGSGRGVADGWAVRSAEVEVSSEMGSDMVRTARTVWARCSSWRWNRRRWTRCEVDRTERKKASVKWMTK